MLAAHRRQHRSGAIAIPNDAGSGGIRRLFRRFTSAPSQLLRRVRRRSTSTGWLDDGSHTHLALLQRRPRTVSIETLTSKTDFTSEELKAIYRRFKSECPYGFMHEEVLHRILSQMFPLGNAHPFAHYVFSGFDSNRSGAVSFEQFACCLNVLLKGSYEQRLRWIFGMYDINRDGEVSRRELAELLSAIFELLGHRVQPPVSASVVQARADVAFDEMDVDGDGSVSWEDFRHFCFHRPFVLQGIDSLRTPLT